MPINLQMNFTNTRNNVYTSTVKTATKLPVIGAKPLPRQGASFVNTKSSSGMIVRGGGGCSSCGGAR